MNLLRYPALVIMLSLTASTAEAATSFSFTAPAIPMAQVADNVSGDSSKCPLRPADLDKLTAYRWRVAQYKSERPFIPNASIRIDFCELIGNDEKGTMRTGVMVNIAKDAHAEAFAKHWRAVCAESIQLEARGKVEPVPNVAGGKQCVTAKGNSSFYWIESPGRTIQIEPETEDVTWAKILPQIMAAAART